MSVFSQTKEKILGKVLEIPVNEIVPNPHQPRKTFNDYDLRELSVSISQNGILQPLSVRKLKENSYELIAGERRLRAAKLAGLTHVPCIEINTSVKNSAILSLIENIQRENLNFFEEACGIAKLIDFYGITQEETAKKIGKSQSAIANKLRLLKLSDAERKLISDYGLTERHARTLLRIPDRNIRIKAIENVNRQHLNVSQTEALVDKLTDTPSKREQETPNEAVKPISPVEKVKLFSATLDRAIRNIENAGIDTIYETHETEKYIEYFIKIPIEAQPDIIVDLLSEDINMANPAESIERSPEKTSA